MLTNLERRKNKEPEIIIQGGHFFIGEILEGSVIHLEVQEVKGGSVIHLKVQEVQEVKGGVRIHRIQKGAFENLLN